jgi:hypothetical protein
MGLLGSLESLRSPRRRLVENSFIITLVHSSETSASDHALDGAGSNGLTAGMPGSGCLLPPGRKGSSANRVVHRQACLACLTTLSGNNEIGGTAQRHQRVSDLDNSTPMSGWRPEIPAPRLLRNRQLSPGQVVQWPLPAGAADVVGFLLRSAQRIERGRSSPRAAEMDPPSLQPQRSTAGRCLGQLVGVHAAEGQAARAPDPVAASGSDLTTPAVLPPQAPAAAPRRAVAGASTVLPGR